jgi:hypothetical protein
VASQLHRHQLITNRPRTDAPAGVHRLSSAGFPATLPATVGGHPSVNHGSCPREIYSEMPVAPPSGPHRRVRVFLSSTALSWFMSVRKAVALGVPQLGMAAFFIAGVTPSSLGTSAGWFVVAATVWRCSYEPSILKAGRCSFQAASWAASGTRLVREWRKSRLRRSWSRVSSWARSRALSRTVCGHRCGHVDRRIALQPSRCSAIRSA